VPPRTHLSHILKTTSASIVAYRRSSASEELGFTYGEWLSPICQGQWWTAVDAVGIILSFRAYIVLAPCHVKTFDFDPSHA
jgi:hypothetical protein